MSAAEARRLVAKLWNYCDVLRDDGVSSIDYVEQLTYLLFLAAGPTRSCVDLEAVGVRPAHRAAFHA